MRKRGTARHAPRTDAPWKRDCRRTAADGTSWCREGAGVPSAPLGAGCGWFVVPAVPVVLMVRTVGIPA